MRNCHKELDWSIKAQHLSKFSNMMKISGYDSSFRFDIINGAIKRHREFLDKAGRGEIKFYRNRSEIKESKLIKGGNSASSWHLKGETTSTMNVAATPGGALKSKISEALRDVKGPDGGKTQIIERGGKPIFAGIEKRDPFQKQGCAYGEQCFVDEGTNCAQTNVCYEIACTMCEGKPDEASEEGVSSPRGSQARWVAGRRRGHMRRIYVGNTGRSLHGRAIQHMGGLRRGDEGNALYKHCIEEHMNTERPEFVMKVISRHRTNLHRMISEGLAIERVRSDDPRSLLNSKAEWGRTKLVRHSANINIS